MKIKIEVYFLENGDFIIILDQVEVEKLKKIEVYFVKKGIVS